MSGNQPNSVLLYRMVHINNVNHLLVNGLCWQGHLNADPNYINIGDTGLIANRNSYPIKVQPPGGSLGEFIPFYFGPLSPMLLKIKDGNGGVIQRPQEEIVYVVCNLDDILTSCPNWCFTNGHAKDVITEYYNSPNDLQNIDWDIVSERYWHNTEDDFDRMRRKQSEFLVKHYVPSSCILGIATYNKNAESIVQKVVANLGIDIPVKIKPNYYY